MRERSDREISVEYEVLVGVKIDADTGEVTHVVAHTEEFNSVKPFQIYTGGMAGVSPWGGAWGVMDLPEYLPEDHPLYEWALKIVDRIRTHEINVPFSVSPTK